MVIRLSADELTFRYDKHEKFDRLIGYFRNNPIAAVAAGSSNADSAGRSEAIGSAEIQIAVAASYTAFQQTIETPTGKAS